MPDKPEEGFGHIFHLVLWRLVCTKLQIEFDRCNKTRLHRPDIMVCNRRGQLPRLIEPIRLNSPHTPLRAPRAAVKHRPQNLIPEKDSMLMASKSSPHRALAAR
jgi:hypothetical protein